MKKDFSRKALFLAVSGLSIFSGSAMATDCATAIANYNDYTAKCQSGMTGYCMSADYIKTSHPECFSAASSAPCNCSDSASKDAKASTSLTTINATAFTQAMTISNAISTRLAGAGQAFFGRPQKSAMLDSDKGMSAGATPNAWNVWANVDQNDTSYKYRTNTNAGTRGDTDVTNSVFGIDYLYSPRLVFGLSAGFDNGDGHMKIDQNGALSRSNLDTKGWMIAPYLAWQINQAFSLDASIGMGEGEVTWKNKANLTKDKADADRVFAALNLNYTTYVGNWQLNGKASYLYGSEDFENFKRNSVKQLGTKTKNTLDQMRLGFQAGYMLGNVMPYAGISYSNNVRRTTDVGKDYLGRDTFIATAGVNFFSASNKISGGVFYSQELDRSHSDNDIISANINFRF